MIRERASGLQLREARVDLRRHQHHKRLARAYQIKERRSRSSQCSYRPLGATLTVAASLNDEIPRLCFFSRKEKLPELETVKCPRLDPKPPSNPAAACAESAHVKDTRPLTDEIENGPRIAAAANPVNGASLDCGSTLINSTSPAKSCTSSCSRLAFRP